MTARGVRNAVFVFMVLGLPGCAVFNPHSPVESVAVTYATIDALATAAAVSLGDGTISAAQALKIRVMLADAYKWTETAENAITAGQPGAAADYLNLAAATLVSVRALLE